MLRENNLLYKIEKYFIQNNIDPSLIKVQGVSIWPAIRNKYSSIIIKRQSNGFKKKNYLKKIFDLIKINLKRGLNIFYGFKHLFNKYDYVIFTSTLERREKDGKMINKLFESIFTIIDRNKVLIIETPDNTFHYPQKKLADKNTASSQFFKSISDIIIFLNKRIKPKNLIIENESLLLEIKKKFNIKFSYRSHISHIIKLIYVLKFFFRIWRPKSVFVSCYYFTINLAAIYCAKYNKIPVIEFQHGIINNNHLAYNIELSMENNFFPDFLFVFGNYFAKLLKNSKFIKFSNIFSIGNFYLNYIKHNYYPDHFLKEKLDLLKKKYQYIISFTSQWTIEEDAIEFFKEVVNLCKEILIIFIPRDINKDYYKYKLPESILIMSEISKNLDAYKTIKISDIHSTVYSTCAFESIALEKPNILININNLSIINLQDLINLDSNTFVVDTPYDFINKVRSIFFQKRNSLSFYEEDHENLLLNALNQILSIE